MHHFRGPAISIRGQRIALDWFSIGLALTLSVPTGWFVSESYWDTPLAGAIIAPISLTAALIGYELLRACFVSRLRVPQGLRILQPIGSIEDGYRTSPDPGTEFRLEIAAILTAMGVSLTLVISPLFIAGTDHFSVAFLPGFILLGYALIQLVPAFPMSGGAVLRAIFWSLHERHSSGTRAAFLYSQFVSASAMAFGGYFLISQAETILPGLWGLFLGFVVLRSARAELLRATIIERASNVRAVDAISGLNPTIRAASSITEAIDIMLEQRENGPALVRDRNVYIGTIDLRKVRDVPREQWRALTAADVAIPFDRLIDSEPDIDLLSVIRRLEEREDTPVIVREADGEIIGLVDRTMEPRLLLRRGIARSVRRISDELPTHRNTGTS